MKNYILKAFLLLTTLTFIISCSKDDEPVTEPSLIGNWEFSKETNSAGVFVNYQHEVGCGKDKLEFTAATLKSTSFDSSTNGTVVSCTETIESFSYNRNGNLLTVNAGQPATILTIVSITATELTLKQGTGPDESSVILKRL